MKTPKVLIRVAYQFHNKLREQITGMLLEKSQVNVSYIFV